MGYTEACGAGGSNSNIVATGGIDKKGITGAYKELFWVADSVEASVAEIKDQAWWNGKVASGDAIYLGSGKFEDQSTEASFFEDTALSIREQQTAATKVIRFTSAICACSHAEIRKMNGKEGRLFIRTSKGFVIGRLKENGKVTGRALSQLFVGQRSVPTNDQPVEYTSVDFTFADNEGDELNPAEVKIEFIFSEVDQVFPVNGKSSSTSSNGSALTTTLTVTKDCSTAALSGIVVGDLKAVDSDGNTLTVASCTESGSTGVYTVSITTAKTLAYLSFNGIKAKVGVNYYLDQVRVSTS